MERRVSDSHTDPVYLSVNTYTSVDYEEVGEVSDTTPVCLYLSVNTYTSVENEVVGEVSP